MSTTTDTTPDTIDQLRAEWNAACGRLGDAKQAFFDVKRRTRDLVAERLSAEHPLVWETFEAHDAEFLVRHGTVEQSAGEDGDGWYVACDEPLEDDGWMIRGESGVFCAHAGPFDSEAEAWKRLDALREVPDELLDPWAAASAG